MQQQVITLQFGGFANYAGAHYWNIQDELLGLQEGEATHEAASQVSSAVLYREGETQRGQPTYVPRLVLFDAGGSLGALPTYNSPHGEPRSPVEASAEATWGGRSEVHRRAPVPRSGFVEELEAEAAAEERGEAAREGAGPGGGAEAERPLEAAARRLQSAGHHVRYFTDYLKAALHPRSAFLLEGVWQGDPGLAGWGGLADYFAGEERREAAADRIRGFAEECDSLGGIQCFVEDLSAWGKAAADVLQGLRDDYSGCKVMLYALRPGAPRDGGDGGDDGEHAQHVLRQRRLAEGLSAAMLAQQCDVYVPVAVPPSPGALPLLRWQQGDWFQEGALCAAALDSATLPYRLACDGGGASPIGATDMWALAQLLTSEFDSPLAALSMALPAPPLPADPQRAAEQADDREGRGTQAPAVRRGDALTSGAACLSYPGVGGRGDAHTFAECVVLRGARCAGAAAPLHVAMAALDASLLAEGVRCVRHRALSTQPIPIPLPFPSVFAPTVTTYGDIQHAPVAAGGHQVAAGGHQVAACPALVRLAGSTALGPAVLQVGHRFAAAAGQGQGQAMLDAWVCGAEERAGVRERLLQLGHTYDRED